MLRLMKLEDRIVLDGAAMSSALDHADDAPDTQDSHDHAYASSEHNDEGFSKGVEEAAALLSASDQEVSGCVDVVLIADDIHDPEKIASAVASEAKVFVFDADIQSAEEILAQTQSFSKELGMSVNSLTVISHGDADGFRLGRDEVRADTVSGQGSWAGLAEVLSDDASIHIYGCGGEGSRELVDALSLATGAKVYASDDITGSGGDWDLEVSSDADAGHENAVLDTQVLAGYDNRLSAVTIDEDTSYAFTGTDFGGDFVSIRITHLERAGDLRLDGAEVVYNQEITKSEIDAGKLTFTPNKDAYGQDYSDFKYKMDEGTGYTDPTYTMTLHVTPVQDPPTGLDNTVSMAEDEGYVFRPADFGFDDVDEGDSFKTLRIATLPEKGELRLNGALVAEGEDIGIDDITAGNLVYTPFEDENGTDYASFDFHVGDGKDISENSNTMNINVTPVNDLPQAKDNLITLEEDTVHTFSISDFGYEDVDGDELEKVLITQYETAGELLLDGETVAPLTEISAQDIADGKLTFAPEADANGEAYAVFRFKVYDGTDYSVEPNHIQIDITPVNDPPTAEDNTVSVKHNESLTFSAKDFQFSDVDAEDSFSTLRIVESVHAGTLALNGDEVTGGQEILVSDIEAGKLVFTPENDVVSDNYASFDFAVNDGNGESLQSYTLTIDVVLGDIPPAGEDHVIQMEEDGGEAGEPYVFSEGDFPFSSENEKDFAGIKIVQLETAGDLLLSGEEVALNQEISLEEIQAGSLTFMPNKDANGEAYSNFRYKVYDGDLYSTDPYRMTISVTPIQDAPTTLPNSVSVMEAEPDEVESGYRFRVEDFIFNDVDEGDTLQAIRISNLNLPEGAGLTLNGEAVTDGQIVEVADIQEGNLKFQPKPYSNGEAYATFDYSVSDGIDYSADPALMTIDVIAVNQAPSAEAAPVIMKEDGGEAGLPYTFSLDNFVYDDFDGDDIEAILVIKPASAGNLMLNGIEVGNGKLITKTDIAEGRLTFMPNADAFGESQFQDYENMYADFQFRVYDGEKYSKESYMMPIIVTPVNDPPEGADNFVETEEDLIYVFSVEDFANGYFDREEDPMASIRITTTEGKGDLRLFGEEVTPGTDISVSDISAGGLTFTPVTGEIGDPENAYAYTDFRYRVSDGQSINSLSVDDYSMTIGVKPVAPSLGPTEEPQVYVENQADICYVDDAISLEDANSENLAGATIQITNNFHNNDFGKDVLSFTDPNGGIITSHWDQSTGTLTLSGTASIAQYEAALRAVRFHHEGGTNGMGDNPVENERTIMFTVTDDEGYSSQASRNVFVDAVNDAPTLAAEDTDPLYGLQDGAMEILEGATISDIDDVNMSGATIRITENYQEGEDRLVFTDTAQINGSWDPSTGTLTLSGTADKAAWANALMSVGYENVGATPSGGQRVVTFQVLDANSGGYGDGAVEASQGLGGYKWSNPIAITLDIARPHEHVLEGPAPYEGITPFDEISRPVSGDLGSMELGGLIEPINVLATGRLHTFMREAYRYPMCEDIDPYECCTLEEVLRIGCRFAPATHPDQRFCSVRFTDTGWDSEIHLDEEYDFYRRLFMYSTGDDTFNEDGGILAQAYMESQIVDESRIMDEEHDIYTQLSMQEGETLNAYGPGEIAAIFYEGREHLNRPLNWRNDGGDPNNC